MLEQTLIEILRSDHKELERYVTDIEGATGITEAEASFLKLKDAAESHFKAEETSVYARCREEKDETLEGFVKNGERDQSDIKEVLWSMESGETQSPVWKEKVRDLKSKVENYSYREDRDLFPQLTKLFNENEMDKIRKEYISFSHGPQVKAA